MANCQPPNWPRKTNAGRWSRLASTRDLSTIAFFRAGPLLRRNGPVPGIQSRHRPGAIMDKSGRHFVATHSTRRAGRETTLTTGTKSYNESVSTLERRAPVFALGYYESPLVDWARSFLLSDAYLASCALN